MEMYHLLESGGQWRILAEGLAHALGVFDSKADAIEAAAVFFGDRTGTLQIHAGDGEVEEELHYPLKGGGEQ